MVKFWLVVVVVLFMGVQLFQWLQGVILPLPLYVMAGAFLAIASNYDKGMVRFMHRGGPVGVTYGETLQAQLNDAQSEGAASNRPSSPGLPPTEFVDDASETPQSH
jgi:hypothetical protein